MMLTGLADVLRAAGLSVSGVPGWRERGHGPMTDVLGVTCHHTGGLKDLDTIVHGRSDLAGPLAHLFLDRAGVYHVVAAGLCWHAGTSRKPEYTNSHRIGIEAEAIGVPGAAGDWPAVQMDAYAAGCAALAEHYQFPVSQVLGHKETCAPPGRKSDPDFDMTAFRARVARIPTDGDDMQPTDKTKLTAAQAAALTAGGHTCAEGDEVSWAWLWMWGGPGLYGVKADVDQLQAQGAATTKALAAITAQNQALTAALAVLTAKVEALPTSSTAGDLTVSGTLHVQG